MNFTKNGRRLLTISLFIYCLMYYLSVQLLLQVYMHNLVLFLSYFITYFLDIITCYLVCLRVHWRNNCIDGICFPNVHKKCQFSSNISITTAQLHFSKCVILPIIFIIYCIISKMDLLSTLRASKSSFVPNIILL